MIVKNSGDGKTFMARVEYLTHDPKAKTAERIDWTHTINLANSGENIPAAMNEMYLTAENAELLKHQAGVRGGGRSTERPVKHYSLSWAVSDNPTQEHMIETAAGFLRYMGWEEHQVILISHNDKPYKHVHLLINAIHPETGLRLDDDFENKRAQKWASQYERQQGRIHCEQREKNVVDRERNMPRNIWMEFKPHEQQFIATAKLAENYSDNPGDPKDNEWKALKILQRAERMEFVESWRPEFKQVKNNIYGEVKEEFRERWAHYFWSKRHGLDSGDLAAMKDRLIADRKTSIEAKSIAFQDFKEQRDRSYRELLDDQKTARGELKYLQKRGLDTREFFEEQLAKYRPERLQAAFRDSAKELGASRATPKVQPRHQDTTAVDVSPKADRPDVGANVSSKSRDRIAASFGSFLDALFFDVTTMGSAKPEPISREAREEKEHLFRQAADDALKRDQMQTRDEEDVAWRERQRSNHRER